MTPSKGYYCLVQYCPDMLRLEAANIGVLLFCPEQNFLQACMSKNNKRIQKFFGNKNFDFEQIKIFKKGMEDRLLNESNTIHSLSDLEHFIALQANQIQITNPRPMKVRDPKKDLVKLFEDIIGKEISHKRAKPLRKIIEEVFDRAHLWSKLRRDLSVKVPVMQNEMKIPFGFQNGRLNLIKPVEFKPKPEKSALDASRFAIEGQYLFKNPDPEYGERQLVVIGDFSPKDHESAKIVMQMFQDHNVKLFRSEELPKLVEEIKKTGKEILHSEK